MPVFPAMAGGLQVHGVRWTVEARDRGLARGVIAVAGYLGMDEIPAGCRDRRVGIFGSFCERVAVLGEHPWDGATNLAPDAPGFHLHPQFPAGVAVPSQAAFVALSASTQTPPVVIVGRFDDDRAAPCVPGGRHCGQEFVVERVAWVDDATFPTTLAVDPGLVEPDLTGGDLRDAADAAMAALPHAAWPLLTVLVRPTTIARIDPGAAEAAARLDPAAPVWFVRGLHERGDPTRIDWLIVNLAGTRVLASGTIATTRFPGSGDVGGSGG